MNIYIRIYCSLMSTSLPSGPPLPGPLQTLLFLNRPFWFSRWCQRRYGDVFRLKVTLPGQEYPGPIVYLANPAAIKELFALDGRKGHAGVANTLLEPVIGSHSLLVLDKDEHLRERRLLSPAFHGEALTRLDTVVRQATTREIEDWPANGTFALRPAMQRITFEVIMRAVLGVNDAPTRDRLLGVLDPVFNLSSLDMVGLIPAIRIDAGPWSPWGRLRRALDQVDEALFDLISARRHAPARDDILGLFLSSTDEDGNWLGDRHIRDELLTLMLAGHETTATALAWAFERLAHHPRALASLRPSIMAGDEQAMEAVAAETLRVRPIVMDVARRLSEEAEIGGYLLPAGTTVVPGIYLVHYDAANHDDPEKFDPSRFADHPPRTETWLPFGGGRRRCIGAGLAQLEMRIVLSTILGEYTPEPASRREERPRLRGITFAPRHGARLRMRRTAAPSAVGVG